MIIELYKNNGILWALVDDDKDIYYTYLRKKILSATKYYTSMNI